MSDMPTPAEVVHAHEVLRRMYKEPVLPLSRFCNGLTQWGNAISQEGAGDPEGPRMFGPLVEVRGQLELAIRKSNLLHRLLYLGESLRTEKCPTHDGHWSGYGRGFDGPVCDCQRLQNGSWQLDLTGWLPGPLGEHPGGDATGQEGACANPKDQTAAGVVHQEETG